MTRDEWINYITETYAADVDRIRMLIDMSYEATAVMVRHRAL